MKLERRPVGAVPSAPGVLLLSALLLAALALHGRRLQLLVVGRADHKPHKCSESPAESALVGPRPQPRHHFVWLAAIEDWALADEPPAQEAAEDTHTNGLIWPQTRAQGDDKPARDRIVEQLQFEPRRLLESPVSIALAHEPHLELGQAEFLRLGCRVNRCRLTQDLAGAQLLVLRDADVSPVASRWPRLLDERSPERRAQIWLAHLLESPPNTFERRFERLHRTGRHAFNWTATYRSDSDIVTPYAKFVPYARTIEQFVQLKRAPDCQSSQQNESLPEVVDAKGGAASRRGPRRRPVAWFVSNCHTPNERLEYARQLAKHIQVDIYGKCGNLTCAKWSHAQCLDHLNRHYDFYLAFENSNHHEYITEKLYQNALGLNEPAHKLVPIVMGPKKSDYVRLAPPKSFIHVDDFASPRHLAQHLLKLRADPQLYESYFRWKSLGRFIDTKFLCRVCALAHETLANPQSEAAKTYPSLRLWWLGQS